MGQTYPETWTLDTIFPGGSSNSEAFKKHITALEKQISNLKEQVDKLQTTGERSKEAWADVVVNLQDVSRYTREAGAFISCLTAQDINDHDAKLTGGKISQLASEFAGVMTAVDHQLLDFTAGEWDAFINEPEMAEIVFNLNERRDAAKEKLPPEQEQLIQKLSVDGYQAWGDFYSILVGRMEIEVELDGEVQKLSVGQASNKLSSASRDVRKHVFDQLEKAWQEESELFTNTLNHLSGYRLAVYEARGWENVLKEPLQINRMQEKTLNVMWDTITANKDTFVTYLDRKAQVLGVEKLAMYDLGAPLSDKVSEVPYDDAADMIVSQFRQYSPQMADFAKKAFQNGWIEAEDRPGKRPGGFCTSFPIKEESRIFMTYDGSASNVATLAHELGHAYHQAVMNDLPQMAQRYAMNVAETASTFAEMIVADAAVEQAESEEEKIQLLDDKLSRSIAFFMNIHSRFLFETRFYEERRRGPVSTRRMNELMEEAQKEAYCGELSEYSPTFWASKLHFHITGVPFYNFPYTFGYLFSMGIYNLARQKGTDFEAQYTALLRDTGRMTVEDLAKKHLNVDLTQADFWQEAIDFLKHDVALYLALTENKIKLN
ncbi:M3 family oligoendopeptidase [Salisediminibacterium beveridgei]|uniref:Oligoendopeptidase F n=1 Tax=Salisediminibacterium beveridgei TaxID=632773 RepID=A0A1D7QR55_9BACI|nr:M3 family oligoendopeptidase [Salisediminibacterium beveridgei]AOM81502.1 Oligoendopeptidase F [Salisediminibacterium beveridgei]